MKVVKLRIDTVFARQLTELCSTLGITLEEYAEAAVLAKTEELISAIRKKKEGEAKSSETQASL
jgi:hypothetical protein